MDTTVPGLGLTDRGRAQARVWAELQHASGPVDAFAASTMLRAQETAAELTRLTGREAVVDGRLREVEVGELGDLPTIEGLPIYYSFLKRWEAGEVDERVPGGEIAADAAGRFGAALADLPVVDGGTAVVVAHASVIRLWTGICIPDSRTSVVGTHVDNTGRFELHRDGRATWRFVAVHPPTVID